VHSGGEASKGLNLAACGRLPTISVVVAFRDSECCVLDCLDSILRMDYPHDHLEIIAVDDQSSDALAAEIHKSYPNVRLLRSKSPKGCNSAKRDGALASTGDIVACTDADCLVGESWGRTIAKNLTDGADAVTGPVRHPKTLLRELVGIADFPDYQDNRHRSANAYVGCNYAINRSLLHTFQFRDYEILFGGDRLDSWQLYSSGHKIAYDPDMVVQHYPQVDFANMLERRLRYGMKALEMRKIDPTLPGGRLIGLGYMAVPAYLAYKMIKDGLTVFGMLRQGHVHPAHIPLVLPMLFLFRLLDSVGIVSAQRGLRRKSR